MRSRDPELASLAGLCLGHCRVGLRKMKKRNRKERNLEESPLGSPTSEASGTGASWGRALSPGPGHSRAIQTGELEQRGGWHFMHSLMAL